MKLFYASGACSLSPHIVAQEAGIELRLQKVDLKTKTITSEGDFLAINPKGYVPALQLDNGAVLTEGAVIVQYLADLKPEKGLAPAAGTFERYRLQEWLTFINSELHKSYSPLFRPDTPAEDLSPAALKRLHASCRAVLERGIANRGASFKDYVDGQGRPGTQHMLVQVFRRDGKPCYTCGTMIQRSVVAQRGTHFCPKCQPKARATRKTSAH